MKPVRMRRPEEDGRRERLNREAAKMREANRGKVQGRTWDPCDAVRRALAYVPHPEWNEAARQRTESSGWLVSSADDNGWSDFRPRCEICGQPLNQHWRGRPCLANAERVAKEGR